MRTHPTYPTDYDLPKKNILVLGCIDLRLTDNLLDFLNSDNLQNRYDQFVLAGASLFCSKKQKKYLKLYENYHESWNKSMEDHVDLAVKLHQIQDVYIVEHRDCGAYSKLLKADFPHQDEFEQHKIFATELANTINSLERKKYDEEGHEKRYHLQVSCFLIGLRGDVELLYKQYSQGIPSEIVKMMASHEHRIHHYLWHQVRNSWWAYSDADRKAIKDLGWEPPRKAYVKDANPRQVDVTNDSGEDFLYMHRVMIANVNKRLKEINNDHYLSINGWQSIPGPGDTKYPVPPAWDTGDAGLNDYLKRVKSDEFYHNEIKPLEDKFKNPEYLKTITLGELGARLEFSIHNWLHMRFCSEVPLTRPDPGTFSTDIDKRWDDPNYNWLGDTYSSHVHPKFWKLHGWVDDRIEDWKKANNINGDINWKGTWLGEMPHHQTPPSLRKILSTDPLMNTSHDEHKHDSEHDHKHHNNMMKVLEIINKSGICSHFYDEIDPKFNK